MEILNDDAICIFPSMGIEDYPKGHPTLTRIHGPDIKYGLKNSSLFGDLCIASWAILLKSYLGTEQVTFGASSTPYSLPDIVSDDQGQNTASVTIFSLRIWEQSTVKDVVDCVHKAATKIPLTMNILSRCNTSVRLDSKGAEAGVGNPTQEEISRGLQPQQVFDMVLIISAHDHHSSIALDISESRFPAPFAQRALQTYHHILSKLLNIDRTRPVGSIRTISPCDLDQISQWNCNNPTTYNTCLHSTFEIQAQRRPYAPAISSWDGKLTYLELDMLSTKLAHFLSKLGVGPEVLVPYAFEKSLYAVVSALAVLKAGGAFVPLDHTHPNARLKAIVSKTGASLILASPRTTSSMRKILPDVVVVNASMLRDLPTQRHNPQSLVQPGNAAFVLFTSGSSGEPKGVVQEHKSVCTINEAYSQALFLNSTSRVLNFAAYTFDVSTVDVFTTLSQGGCVCIPSEHERLNDLPGAINKYGATWIDLTPSYAIASIPRPSDIPTLKTLILAGEPVKAEHIEHFVGQFDHLINCYGPAEAGGCLAYEITRCSSKSPTIGRALPSAVSWVVDVQDSSMLAPIGAVGELVIEGPTLAREYLKDPQRTSNAFFHSEKDWSSCQFGRSIARRRFYRTGDLVKYRMDGNMDFIGRKDTQIKIRGQRLELTEIEQHLAREQKVQLSVVVFPTRGIYSNRLVAIIQPCSDIAEIFAPTLRPLEILPVRLHPKIEYLLARLKQYIACQVPTYMQPSIWLAVSSIPLSDSKKVDRRRVLQWVTGLRAAVESKGTTGQTSRTESRDQIQSAIYDKVISMVAREHHQAYPSFQDPKITLDAIGIDSIKVVTLANWIHNQYSVRIPIEVLTQPALSITSVSQLVESYQKMKEDQKSESLSPNIDIMHELDLVWARIIAADSMGECSTRSDRPTGSTVLVTGCTGFLGIEILNHLLHNDKIKTVIAVVRAKTAKEGLERIVSATRKMKLNSTMVENSVEIWPGDLGLSRLGLNEDNWHALTKPDSVIDAIIHCGASVKWNASYKTLKAPNVLSTVILLEILAKRRAFGAFIYVSGGQRLSNSMNRAEDEQIAAIGSTPTGYTQTKLVSELLCMRFARSALGQRHSIHVVKPSYIIGDITRGIANPSDYIWRYTKSALELHSYNDTASREWLFVADVTSIAERIAELCSPGSPMEPTFVQIFDGLLMQDFWRTLATELGTELHPVDGREWWSRLRAQVNQAGPKHCLWALQYMLSDAQGEIASIGTVPTDEMKQSRSHVTEAVQRNIRFLRDEGYFLQDDQSRVSKL